ncbi:hypothetical protein SAMN02745857_01064 [Andreprevotia lacus DSM 23236]|jgi:hypothetical protein|uniref:Uncharacterized protein n=1 Tax=Andreprevotia lacus DSM 23236 TaxID=1121001 RepID=A0A1W1XA45_9NEIS|nr:hypothetical protein [Andreprevotia lacus]SMC20875.1 hypothetical protein SAMN02745857_01064 [Andreprevotia lacus DSM 23236]
MSSNSFLVNDYHELIALQRVFREAKFCFEASDPEISASPIVARLFDRLLDTLIEVDVTRKGDIARKRWADWLSMHPAREEWQVSVRRAAEEHDWDHWSEDERISYARTLLSPFILAQDLIELFIEEVSTARHTEE